MANLLVTYKCLSIIKRLAGNDFSMMKCWAVDDVFSLRSRAVLYCEKRLQGKEVFNRAKAINPFPEIQIIVDYGYF